MIDSLLLFSNLTLAKDLFWQTPEHGSETVAVVVVVVVLRKLVLTV
jgi:hypothetical protein